jgi:hypothetical protein
VFLKGEYVDNQELDGYIDKFNHEKDIKLSIIDHLRIFNYLKELRTYRDAGMLSEVFDLKSKYKTIKFAHDLQEDVIQRLEKSNGEMADELVKLKGLISESEMHD